MLVCGACGPTALAGRGRLGKGAGSAGPVNPPATVRTSDITRADAGAREAWRGHARTQGRCRGTRGAARAEADAGARCRGTRVAASAQGTPTTCQLPTTQYLLAAPRAPQHCCGARGAASRCRGTHDAEAREARRGREADAGTREARATALLWRARRSEQIRGTQMQGHARRGEGARQMQGHARRAPQHCCGARGAASRCRGTQMQGHARRGEGAKQMQGHAPQQ
jgi:hypothetical protein